MGNPYMDTGPTMDTPLTMGTVLIMDTALITGTALIMDTDSNSPVATRVVATRLVALFPDPLAIGFQ